MKHVLSAVVVNQPGVLAHVSGMMASRAFNIESLAVGETENPEFSRITFVVSGDEKVLDQIRKQLEKIVTIVRVIDFSGKEFVERDLMLMKVAASGSNRSEVKELVDIFRGSLVDVSPGHVMIEISGPEKKLEAFIDLMRPFDILELVRTGRIALLRFKRGKRRRRRTGSLRGSDRRLLNTRLSSTSRADVSPPTTTQPLARRFQISAGTKPAPRSLTWSEVYLNHVRKTQAMPVTIYYDDDADLSLLKDKTVAILGYGSQGHAQAQNLKDSGCNVVVGQRKGSANYDLAVSHGFDPMTAADAAKAGDLINILLPDEVQGDVFKADVSAKP